MRSGVYGTGLRGPTASEQVTIIFLFLDDIQPVAERVLAIQAAFETRGDESG